MTDIISNIIVGIVILLCVAAGIWVAGYENGWFAKNDKKNEEDNTENTDKECED